jgi:hypothetical protein
MVPARLVVARLTRARVKSMRRLMKRAAVLAALMVAVGVTVLAAPATRSAASVGTVSFSTTPALYPAFDPAVSDYVVRCDAGAPVQVSVSNSDGADTTTTVSVDGQAPQTGAFVASVSLGQGQEFTITVTQGATTKEYFVRCLPADFPTWTSDRPGTPQAEYYVVAPALGSGTGRYVIIYDTNGVPVWWMAPPPGRKPVDAKLTATGDVLWTESDTSGVALDAAERGLDGSTVDDSITPDGYSSDQHDVELLPNGNYLVMGDYSRCCYDLSSYGGPANAPILDNVIQEVTPSGLAVWTWDAADHIGVDELLPQWWGAAAQFGAPFDTLHINSAEMDATGNLLVSFRYEGVYKVTNPTAATNAGKIIWKLGGTAPTMEPGTQLTVVGDPVFAGGGDFGGQHYARFFDAGDGNEYVTLHDNGSNTGRPPRGVRYQIDETAGTATMVEDVRDTADPGFTSICCGSAKRLPGGDWVMSWGFGDSVMELTPTGDRMFVLTFTQPSYRADPVLPGVLTPEELRAGMDTQYVTATMDTDDDGCPDVKEPLLVPPTDPANPWDFFSVPVPALFAAADPTVVFKDTAVGAGDAQAVFAYFKAGAKTGTTDYEQDLNQNGIKDGMEYDRSVAGSGMSGPPDGVIAASDAQLAFAQFKLGYQC